MNKNLDGKTLGSIASIVLVLLVAGGFYWLWSSAQPSASTAVVIDAKYNPIDISGLKNTAESLINGTVNYGDLRVTPPSPDQIGKENPFS